LAGTVVGATYHKLSGIFPKKDIFCFSLSAILGSLTNTLGVMGGIALFFGSQYSTIAGKALYLIIFSTILTSGIPEAIVSAILASSICKPLKIILREGA
jgi:uncharacterized membrane protein